jgi:hypothetical protein
MYMKLCMYYLRYKLNTSNYIIEIELTIYVGMCPSNIKTNSNLNLEDIHQMRGDSQ